MTWCMFANDQSDGKRIHIVRRVPLLTYTANGSKLRKMFEKDVNYEDIISHLKPYSLLLYVSNESFIEKVRSKT